MLQKKNKFCLSLHYDRENSYLFVNGIKIIKFKPKIPEIILPRPLCLGNISKDWPEDKTDMFMIFVLIMMILQLMIF